MTRGMSGQMTRGRKARPGRVVFVGSGPGDPGLLTVRARNVLACAEVVFTDPDVPPDVLALVGAGLPERPKLSEPDPGIVDDTVEVKLPVPDVRPALGDPAEVAKTLASEARAGVDVVRLVAGDPLSIDPVITEVNAIAKTALRFEIVPGLTASSAVPTYAGLPLGSSHTVADVRGDVDWAALAAAPGPLILHATAEHLAEAAKALIDFELAETTPCVVTAHGTTTQQRSVETTLSGLTDRAVIGGTDSAGPLTGPLIVTIGRTVANRAKLNWWESRALYGWTVLVPRTKDQAADMSQRLISPAAQPRADGASREGPRRRPLPVGGVHVDQRGTCGLGEVQRVRARCSGVLGSEDRLRRAGHRRPRARVRDRPRTRAIRRAVVAGPAGRVPAVRRRFRSGQQGVATPGGHRHRDAGRRTARTRVGDRGRHRVPHGARRAAAGGDARDDQVRRLRRGVFHVELDGAQPCRHRGQAAHPHDRGMHRAQDRRDRRRIRAPC